MSRKFSFISISKLSPMQSLSTMPVRSSSKRPKDSGLDRLDSKIMSQIFLISAAMLDKIYEVF
ncbi:hypothetical protein BpHYR1_027950 [Brachionus plicatilis]|uniref:Uncharacterized protein n=1 Tax=Brachionus plicatilis TaxID=10195 RepID=A0A3M7R211_BRAPC|nr:hypothetical protein BpHYR1_027950 [Brachionus plicatilis]